MPWMSFLDKNLCYVILNLTFQISKLQIDRDKQIFKSYFNFLFLFL